MGQPKLPTQQFLRTPVLSAKERSVMEQPPVVPPNGLIYRDEKATSDRAMHPEVRAQVQFRSWADTKA
jgi:hypothetical protein